MNDNIGTYFSFVPNFSPDLYIYGQNQNLTSLPDIFTLFLSTSRPPNRYVLMGKPLGEYSQHIGCKCSTVCQKYPSKDMVPVSVNLGFEEELSLLGEEIHNNNTQIVNYDSGQWCSLKVVLNG